MQYPQPTYVNDIKFPANYEIPDLGSIVVTNNRVEGKDGMCSMEGLLADKDKIPDLDWIKEGSSYLALDTRNYFKKNKAAPGGWIQVV